ncbi:MAG: hypothetical protein K2N03_03210 [Muribaculaceae bacterium]|nr:hypothetical protein [Muribaculaceae bacterium]
MKTLKLFIGAAILSLGVSANAQSFSKGDIVADLNIGIGQAKTTESSYNLKNKAFDTEKATKGLFTQRLGIEFGVYDFNEKSSLGVGFSFLNGVGFTHQVASGTYNYDYTILTYTKGNRNTWHLSETESRNRTGSGTALAKAAIEDFTAMVRVAYHYTLLKNLDTYAGIGFGVSHLSTVYSDFSHESGFGKINQTLDKDYRWSTQYVYSYNDRDHVKWENGGGSGRFAAAIFLGARYYITPKIGIQAEVGLPNVTFKKDLNNYSFFSCGASYKF